MSTEDQQCALQLDEMRSYCERRGWRVYGEYVDTGWSGARADRPQLAKIMKDASLHRFDAVLTWKLDRFGRSAMNLLDCLQQLDGWNVRFMCISQTIDTDQTNPASKLLIHILAAVAEFERSMIKERVKAGMKAAQRRGTHCGRSKKVFDRDQVAQLHLQGKTVRQIAATLCISKSLVADLLKKQAA